MGYGARIGQHPGGRQRINGLDHGFILPEFAVIANTDSGVRHSISARETRSFDLLLLLITNCERLWIVS
jgi:hypothetical protein